jgi:protein-S-isoprenylcysteine O-methyltransferase Ste14
METRKAAFLKAWQQERSDKSAVHGGIRDVWSNNIVKPQPMNIWRHVARQAQNEYSAGARLTAMACAGLIFVFGIPAFLFWLSALGGNRWQFKSSPVLSAFCLVLAALGLFLVLWTGWVQFHHARGTPIPVMATKKLLTDKPYSFCRNPMALGTLVFYFSIAIFTSSFMAVLAVFLFALLLITYIKLVEEKEMSLRFGDEYARYKQSTPFIIPRPSLHSRKSGL